MVVFGAGASHLPSDAAELGEGLRKLRTLGLKKLADSQVRGPGLPPPLSKSTLHRYEQGKLLPPLEHAKRLDQLYSGDGWVEVSLRSLWRSSWDPWASPDGGTSMFHSVEWPARYSGVVWMKLKPTKTDVDQLHRFHLAWGAWIRDVELRLPAAGVLLLTGKAIDYDDVARTCNVTANRRVYLLHGAGDQLHGETIIDIRQGWQLMSGEGGVPSSTAIEGG